MTDEEREKLCADLRLGVPDRPPRCCLTDIAAAEEIERLAYELRISNRALKDCSNECTRCYELSEKFEAKQKKEIERLTKELEEAKRHERLA